MGALGEIEKAKNKMQATTHEPAALILLSVSALSEIGRNGFDFGMIENPTIFGVPYEIDAELPEGFKILSEAQATIYKKVRAAVRKWGRKMHLAPDEARALRLAYEDGQVSAQIKFHGKANEAGVDADETLQYLCDRGLLQRTGTDSGEGTYANNYGLTAEGRTFWDGVKAAVKSENKSA
ncbi:MAG: hypothetical protein Q7S99_03240 [Parvibaculum sp.]|nr:hypothetical protein [Parvibaculum sp.]